MRILFIAKNNYYQEIISNSLKELSEKDSIIFFYSYEDAEDYVNNNIVKNQSIIDLIILENNIAQKKVTEFYQSITKDKERIYSNCDFKFYKIPVVLILDENENRATYLKYGFTNVLNNVVSERLNFHVSDFRNVVKSWRSAVLDELDNLGIKFNSGKINYTYYFSQKRKKHISTKILSENFKRLTRKLNYDWLINNEKQIEIAIDKFVNELKKATLSK